MAVEPNAGAESEERFPRNVPTGVRAADKTTVLFIMLRF
jgi:hypothetical protein